jgi:nucleotide-binding universal stress UspA family protein
LDIGAVRSIRTLAKKTKPSRRNSAVRLIDKTMVETRPEPGAPTMVGELKMAFHSSLVMASGADAASAIDVAFQLAKRSNGHVTGLHVSGDPIANMPSVVEGMAERMIIMEFQKARDRLETNERVSRETFTEACARHGGTMVEVPAPSPGVTATWRVTPGRPEKILAEQARVHDVLIGGATGNTVGDKALEVIETALFDAGRPVLVVPRTTPASIGKNILIGWNRTANAARAVMAAMPLITSAEKVEICHVNTGAKPGPSPEDLAASLAWHGVDASVRHIQAGGAPVSDLIMTEAANTGGDLVIMGAYSHSRMQEFVMGGVTRHALRHVVTPLLMMH